MLRELELKGPTIIMQKLDQIMESQISITWNIEILRTLY